MTAYLNFRAIQVVKGRSQLFYRIDHFAVVLCRKRLNMFRVINCVCSVRFFLGLLQSRCAQFLDLSPLHLLWSSGAALPPSHLFLCDLLHRYPLLLWRRLLLGRCLPLSYCFLLGRSLFLCSNFSRRAFRRYSSRPRGLRCHGLTRDLFLFGISSGIRASCSPRRSALHKMSLLRSDAVDGACKES